MHESLESEMLLNLFGPLETTEASQPVAFKSSLFPEIAKFKRDAKRNGELLQPTSDTKEVHDDTFSAS